MDVKHDGFSHRTCFFQVCILRCHVSFLGFVEGDLLLFDHGESPLNHHLGDFFLLFLCKHLKQIRVLGSCVTWKNSVAENQL